MHEAALFGGCMAMRAAVMLMMVLLSACSNQPAKKDALVTATAKVADVVRLEQTQKPVSTTESLAKDQAPDLEKLALNEALELARTGHVQEAEKRFVAMLKDYPANAAAYVDLAIIYYQKYQLKEAEETFGKALKAYETSAVTYNYLGIIYRKTGRFEEAAKAYEKAVDLNQNYAYAYLNMGILHDLYLRDYAKAILAYKNYLKLVPAEEKQVNSWIADLNKRMKSDKKKVDNAAIP